MFVLLLLVEAVSVSACNFGDNNWALGCDFPGNDFKNLQIPGEQCGPACVDDARCTHFTWNTYKDGTCWLKEGQASDIICNNDQGFVCGQIVHKNCEPNFGDKNWAFQCDFPGNDIRNVKVEASECGQACSDDARCTHFAWNKDDGCWLKGTKKLFTDAVCTRNPSDICGCVRGCDEGLDTLKDCKPKFGDKSWALRCEFPGEGFKTVQVPASGCGPTCLWDTRCTHFSWTSANNGSCVLKSGRIAFSDAICTKDFDTVCGCERNCSREIVVDVGTLPTLQSTIPLLPDEHPLQHVSWRTEIIREIIGGITDVGISLNLTSDGPATYSIGLYKPDQSIKPCSTVRGTKGECRYLAYCVLDVFLHSLSELTEYSKTCYDGNKELTVCCPLALPSPTITPQYTTTVENTDECPEVAKKVKNSCGAETLFQNRISGGKIANKWPWVAALFSKGEFICGGTLISASHVLTAAHCVLNYESRTSDLSIRLGETDLTDFRSEYAVSRIDRHSKSSQQTHTDDIAVVTLANTTNSDCSVWRICLPRNNFSHFGSEATVIGWGATSTTQKSEVLLQVNTPVLTDSECNATVRSTTYEKDKMLCAAAEDKSICRGDSGGPLMIQVDEKWTIFGVAIASGGTDDECGTGLPSIYTRVDHYYNWIENILYGRIGR